MENEVQEARDRISEHLVLFESKVKKLEAAKTKFMQIREGISADNRSELDEHFSWVDEQTSDAHMMDDEE